MISSSGTSSESLLDVRNLSTQFHLGDRLVRAVDGVSLSVNAGETVGIVGESGSGKSVTAMSMIKLLPKSAEITSGEVLFDGRDLLLLPNEDLETVRGRDVGFIFQDPMSSLNPTLTIGYQIAEPMRVHLGFSRKAATAEALDLLARVGIPHPQERFNDYPHQFSGGMRQRVMIAIALACDPKLLVADEPTTALDVTVQAQIVELLQNITHELKTAIVLITHDLGLAAGICDRIHVMYAGQIVESGQVDALFATPAMPYTHALLRCVPRLDDDIESPFVPITGLPPAQGQSIAGCRFAPRCEHVRPICERAPTLSSRGRGRSARCWGSEKSGWIR